MSDKINLSELTAVEYNPRILSDEQLGRIKQSIVEGTRMVRDWDPNDGLRLNTTITVNKQGMRVVGGNQRIKALLALGQDWIHAEDISWIDVPPGSSEEKERNITLNNPNVAGDWTPDVMSVLGDLEDQIAEGLLGLDVLKSELMERFEDATKRMGEDEVPESPVDPISMEGDLWLLGEHRLLCGDCMKAEDVGRLMGGAKAQLIFTDPPYGVDYDGGAKRREKLSGDHVGTNIYAASLPHLRVAADDRAANEFHPTQKPVAIAARAVSNSSLPSHIVLDMFVGGGTTIIACEQLDRKCYAIEIEPKYVDVCVRRWVNFTGKSDQAVCHRDGQEIPFSELFKEESDPVRR